MQKITSFTIDHTHLEKGIYLSRKDGTVSTLDFRLRRPYLDPTLTTTEMHSLEHLLATALRNGDYKSHVLYVGPMGCATGFYILFDNLSENKMLLALHSALEYCLSFDYMPGNSKTECGDCRTLDLNAGIALAKEGYEIVKGKRKLDLYP